jgi:dephospho-CoA kinase
MIYVIGLTGPIGAGKSTVARIISGMDIPVIDADIVARQVTQKGSPVLGKLIEMFGQCILNVDGSLNRRQLADIAFKDMKSTQRLNEITHPAIISSIKNKITDFENEGKKTVAIEATLLFESGADTLCDAVISVIAPIEIRIKRIILRDQVDEKNIKMRIAVQQDEEFYRSKSKYVIINDDNDAKLQKTALQIICKIIV